MIDQNATTPVTRFHAIIALNTHRGSKQNSLIFDVIERREEALKLLEQEGFGSLELKGELGPVKVAISEGREAALVPPPRDCQDDAEFVERVLQNLDIAPGDKRKVLDRAYDLESKQRYLFEKEAPIRYGQLNERDALRLLRPSCNEPACLVPWEPGEAFQIRELTHLEARQVVLKLTLKQPVVLRIREFAEFADRAPVELGTFVLPLLDV